jgi:hypothetical protein
MERETQESPMVPPSSKRREKKEWRKKERSATGFLCTPVTPIDSAWLSHAESIGVTCAWIISDISQFSTIKKSQIF